MSVAFLYLIIALLSGVAAMATTILGLWSMRFNKARLFESMKLRTYLVTLQKEILPDDEAAKKSPQEIIAVAEQFFATLTLLNRRKKSLFIPRPHIAFEIAATEKNISFYLVAPSDLAETIEKQLNAVYPKASIEPVPEYSVFEEGSQVVSAYLRFRTQHHFPIRTYYALPTDPLNNITNALSKLTEGEGVVVQYLIRPAQKDALKKGSKIAREMAQGKNYHHASRSGLAKFGSGVMRESGRAVGSMFQPKNQQSQESSHSEKPIVLSPTEQRQMEALQGKSSKMNFEVNIRIVASAKTSEEARSSLDHILSSFDQFDDPDLNGFTPKYSKEIPETVDLVYRYFEDKEKLVLNTEELTSVFHLPNQYIETPNIKWLGAQKAPAPTNMPQEGLLLGKNTFRGQEHDVRIAPNDRRRHIYIIGKTGTGKSTLLENMIVQDIRNGEGVGVVDPHGELIENILPFIPRERAEDVILFDPGATDRPMGLNMLEFKTNEQKDFAVDEMIGIFHKLFPPEMIGPIFEHNMRNVMLTLMENPDEPGTIAEIPRMFTDEAFQKKMVARLKDPVVRAFWEQEMAKTTDFHKSEALGYMVSKVGQFVENKLMRNIIGQRQSAFDFRDVMDNKKILLVNLSKGKVGELNSSLLGLILVSKLQMAAMTRVNIPEEERKDFHLYLDEFQNVTTDSIAVILSEARKYHLTLTIAHQFVAQLEDKIREAVFGNVGTMMAFRIGPADAEYVVKQFAPVFSEVDLVNIDKFNAYVKLIIDGTPARAFSMQLSAPNGMTHPDWKNEKVGEAIRELSHLKYGRPREVVEADIMQRAQLYGPSTPEPTPPNPLMPQ
jgi:hypothetical protein